MYTTNVSAYVENGLDRRRTVSLQSIIRKNSRSSMLSSPTGIPPTLAYRLFVQKASQSALLDTATAVMRKR